MQITISKRTANAVNLAIRFLLCGVSDNETHSKIEPENLKVLGVNHDQVFDLIKLRDQIKNNLKPKKNGRI